MPKPQPYIRRFEFEDWQRGRPKDPLPGDAVDVELDDIKRLTDEMLGRMGLIQRDDGALMNGIVGKDQLSAGLTLGLNPRGTWAPGEAYEVDDTVWFGTNLYRARVAHTATEDGTPPVTGEQWSLLLATGGVGGGEGGGSGGTGSPGLSVVSLGADPTGSAPSDAALAAALATGKSIWFEDGTYRFTGTTLVPAKSLIKSNGSQNVTILSQGSGPWLDLQRNTNGAFDTDWCRSAVVGFTIQASGSGIQANGHEVFIEDVVFHGGRAPTGPRGAGGSWAIDFVDVNEFLISKFTVGKGGGANGWIGNGFRFRTTRGTTGVGSGNAVNFGDGRVFSGDIKLGADHAVGIMVDPTGYQPVMGVTGATNSIRPVINNIHFSGVSINDTVVRTGTIGIYSRGMVRCKFSNVDVEVMDICWLNRVADGVVGFGGSGSTTYNSFVSCYQLNCNQAYVDEGNGSGGAQPDGGALRNSVVGGWSWGWGMLPGVGFQNNDANGVWDAHIGPTDERLAGNLWIPNPTNGQGFMGWRVSSSLAMLLIGDPTWTPGAGISKEGRPKNDQPKKALGFDVNSSNNGARIFRPWGIGTNASKSALSPAETPLANETESWIKLGNGEGFTHAGKPVGPLHRVEVPDPFYLTEWSGALPAAAGVPGYGGNVPGIIVNAGSTTPLGSSVWYQGPGPYSQVRDGAGFTWRPLANKPGWGLAHFLRSSPTYVLDKSWFGKLSEVTGAAAVSVPADVIPAAEANSSAAQVTSASFVLRTGVNPVTLTAETGVSLFPTGRTTSQTSVVLGGGGRMALCTYARTGLGSARLDVAELVPATADLAVGTITDASGTPGTPVSSTPLVITTSADITTATTGDGPNPRFSVYYKTTGSWVQIGSDLYCLASESAGSEQVDSLTVPVAPEAITGIKVELENDFYSAGPPADDRNLHVKGIMLGTSALALSAGLRTATSGATVGTTYGHGGHMWDPGWIEWAIGEATSGYGPSAAAPRATPTPDYFIDFDAGSNANNGLSAAAPFKTWAAILALGAAAKGKVIAWARGKRHNVEGGRIAINNNTNLQGITLTGYGVGAPPVITNETDIPTGGITTYSGSVRVVNQAALDWTTFTNYTAFGGGENEKKKRVTSIAVNNQWMGWSVGSISDVNAAGKFFHDTAAGKLYFWPPTGVSTITSLKYYSSTIVSIYGTHDVTIHGVTLEGSRDHGVEIGASNNFSLLNSTIRRCGIQGVYWISTPSSDNGFFLAEGNLIEETHGSGLSLSAANGGSVPMRVATNIRYNRVRVTCIGEPWIGTGVTSDDGYAGAIKLFSGIHDRAVWGFHGAIEGNEVLDTGMAYNSHVPNTGAHGPGIWLDTVCGNLTVRGNWIDRARMSGIFVELCPAQPFVIERNIILRTDQNGQGWCGGVCLGRGSSGVIVDRNTIWGSKVACIVIQGMTGTNTSPGAGAISQAVGVCYIRNNILFPDAAGRPVREAPMTPLRSVFEKNLLVGSMYQFTSSTTNPWAYTTYVGLTNWESARGAATGSRYGSAAPGAELVNPPVDFALAAGSQARGMATDGGDVGAIPFEATGVAPPVGTGPATYLITAADAAKGWLEVNATSALDLLIGASTAAAGRADSFSLINLGTATVRLRPSSTTFVGTAQILALPAKKEVRITRNGANVYVSGASSA